MATNYYGPNINHWFIFIFLPHYFKKSAVKETWVSSAWFRSEEGNNAATLRECKCSSTSWFTRCYLIKPLLKCILDFWRRWLFSNSRGPPSSRRGALICHCSLPASLEVNDFRFPSNKQFIKTSATQSPASSTHASQRAVSTPWCNV